jgi:hypothetical protein
MSTPSIDEPPRRGAVAGVSGGQRLTIGSRIAGGGSAGTHWDLAGMRATTVRRRGAAQPQGNAEVSWTGGAAVWSGLVRRTDRRVLVSVTVTFRPTLVPAE